MKDFNTAALSLPTGSEEVKIIPAGSELEGVFPSIQRSFTLDNHSPQDIGYHNADLVLLRNIQRHGRLVCNRVGIILKDMESIFF